MFINQVVSRILSRNYPPSITIAFSFSFFGKISKDNKLHPRHQYQHLQSSTSHNQQTFSPSKTSISQPYQKLREKILNSSTLEDLLILKEDVFNSELKLIPLFVSAITPHVTSTTFKKFQEDFDFINNNINNFSQDLSMSAKQFIGLIDYRVTCRPFEPKYSDTVNFSFQRKAAVVGASLIYKRDLEFNQTIFSFESLLKIGSSSVLLFMNFVKYMKKVFMEKGSSVSLIQLLTILNTNLLKRNEITLEIILYDQVMAHLINNLHFYISNITPELKVEILNILLLINHKPMYRVNYLLKQKWALTILADIIQSLQVGWIDHLLCLKPLQKDQLNYNHIISIIEAINFIFENKFNYQVYLSETTIFLDKCTKELLEKIQQLLETPKCLKNWKSDLKHQEVLIRILFNPSIIQVWVDKQSSREVVRKILKKIEINQQQPYYPLIDAIYFYQSQPSIHQELIQLSKDIINQAKKRNFVIWGLVCCLVPQLSALKALKMIEEIRQINAKESHFLFAILYNQYVSVHKPNNPERIDLLNKDSDPKVAINEFLNSLEHFRNNSVCYSLIFEFLSAPIILSYMNQLKISLESLIEKDQMTILISYYLVSQKNPLKEITSIWDNLFQNEIIRHSFILRCFPDSFPNPRKYNKKVNLLSSQSQFIKNYEFCKNIFPQSRYSSFVWDLFLKNYHKLPLQIRKKSFPILVQIFMKAYEKEKLRKIILLMGLTNEMSSGVIVASKQDIKNLFDKCMEALIKHEEIIQFHYQCYTQIVVNALTLDIMSIETFNKIMKHTFQKKPDLKHTTTLMLLYGSFLKQNKCDVASLKFINNPQMLKEQTKYLSFLSRTNRYKHKSLNLLNQGKQQNQFDMTAKIISIYMNFQTKDIFKLSKTIFQYLESTNQLKQWLLVAYSFNPHFYDPNYPDQQLFRNKITTLLQKKLLYFKNIGLLSEDHEEALVSKLI